MEPEEALSVQIDSLTERERDVLGVARSGASARAIADRLYVSTRTVETHLGSIYRKLGVSSRVELMAMLHRADAVADDHMADSPDGDGARGNAGGRPIIDTPRVRPPRRLPSCLIPTSEYVGRGFEMATLAEAVAGALDGRRSTVVVGGEAGVGKSALVAAAAVEAQNVEVRVLAGRCDPDFRAPFLPFIAILRDSIAAIGADRVRDIGPSAGYLVSLIPELAGVLPERPPAPDPGTARRLLYEGALSVIRQVTRAGPVLIVVEDLHWADAATLGLLRQLMAESTLKGLIVVATFRNTQLALEASLSGLLADLWRDPTVIRLDLDGLSTTETARLARQVGKRPIDAREVELLRSRTNGNPFYLLQLIVDGPGKSGRSSPSLREVILDRVA